MLWCPPRRRHSNCRPVFARAADGHRGCRHPAGGFECAVLLARADPLLPPLRLKPRPFFSARRLFLTERAVLHPAADSRFVCEQRGAVAMISPSLLELVCAVLKQAKAPRCALPRRRRARPFLRHAAAAAANSSRARRRRRASSASRRVSHAP
eukprot:7388202-Prymnesium_polylepis.1